MTATRVRTLWLIILLAVAVAMAGVVLDSTEDARAQQSSGVDFYLKIEGIAGESTDGGHEGEIEILNWSWGAHQGGSAHSGGGGKASMRDFTFAMESGAHSPSLMLANAQGRIIRSATLSVVDPGSGQTVLTWELQNAMIKSFKTASSTGEFPIDRITIDFTRIIVTHTSPTGKVIKAGWDLAKGTKI